MGVRLQRKARRNKVKATQRKSTIKRLLSIPVIKRVDIDILKKNLAEATILHLNEGAV